MHIQGNKKNSFRGKTLEAYPLNESNQSLGEDCSMIYTGKCDDIKQPRTHG